MQNRYEIYEDVMEVFVEQSSEVSQKKKMEFATIWVFCKTYSMELLTINSHLVTQHEKTFITQQSVVNNFG